MARPSFGFIVEGTYDEAIFRLLVPRLIADPDPVLVIRPCGGSTRLRQRFSGFLREFQWLNAGNPLDKAIVIADSDMRAPEEVEAELAATVAQRTYHFPVQSCAIRHEIEAWLLADHDAINMVAQGRLPEGAMVSASPAQQDPECLLDPKAYLQRVLSECRLPYDAVVCGQVAAQLNLDRLRYRCPSFKRFEEKLHDC